MDEESCQKNRADGLRWDYAYDSPGYNWRQLRVMNATHDFSFTQFDPDYIFDAVPRPPAHGQGGGPIQPAAVMVGVNINGKDSPHPCGPATNGSDPFACAAMCKSVSGCKGWTLHLNGEGSPVPGWRCCIKTTVQSLEHAPELTTSGLLDPEAYRPNSPPWPPSGHHGEGGNSSRNSSTIVFSEYYDIKTDPWQQHNLWQALPTGTQVCDQHTRTRARKENNACGLTRCSTFWWRRMC
eukprot:COSAG05_NODE_1633_length_4368_cov_1.606934_3_plen_238_part_00